MQVFGLIDQVKGCSRYKESSLCNIPISIGVRVHDERLIIWDWFLSVVLIWSILLLVKPDPGDSSPWVSTDVAALINDCFVYDTDCLWFCPFPLAVWPLTSSSGVPIWVWNISFWCGRFRMQIFPMCPIGKKGVDFILQEVWEVKHKLLMLPLSEMILEAL